MINIIKSGDDISELIIKNWDKEELMEISFKDVGMVSTSFIDKVLGKVVQRYSIDSLRNKLKIININKELDDKVNNRMFELITKKIMAIKLQPCPCGNDVKIEYYRDYEGDMLCYICCEYEECVFGYQTSTMRFPTGADNVIDEWNEYIRKANNQLSKRTKKTA